MPNPRDSFRESNLFAAPIRDLQLSIDNTPLAPVLEEFQQELRAKGITRLKPRFHLSTEWGVPFGTVVIGSDKNDMYRFASRSANRRPARAVSRRSVLLGLALGTAVVFAVVFSVSGPIPAVLVLVLVLVLRWRVVVTRWVAILVFELLK